jgi:hypothetical protein
MAFDPGEVTGLVGLEPTAAWQRGDPHPCRPGLRRFSSWMYELPQVRTYVTEDVVTMLLDAVEPHAAGLAEACRTLGVRAGIMVVIEMRSRRDEDGDVTVSTPAVGYSAGTIRRLGRLDLEVHHDQYVLLD